MWIFPWNKHSWHSGSLRDKLGWLNLFWQFLCDELSSFNPKGFHYYIRGLAVYVEEGLHFAWDLSLENSTDFYLCFRLALLSVLLLFFCWSSSLSLCTVCDSISSNINEVLSINLSANVFVFGDFNIHHEDWLTYSDGTDRPGAFCYNFLSQITLLRWSTFLLESQTVTPTVLLF